MKKFIATVLTLTLLMSCNEAKKKNSIIASSELSPFVGTWGACQNISGNTKGSLWNASASILYSLTINADGSFSLSKYFFDNTSTCTVAGGVTNPISYSQSGTLTIEGDASAPAGAKEMKFHATSTTVTGRDGAKNFYTDIKGACPFTSWVDTTASTGITIDGDSTCNSGGGLLFFDDINGTPFDTYNVGVVTSTTLSINPPQDWDMGWFGYPNTVGFVMTKQ